MRPTGKPRSLWLIVLVLSACSTPVVAPDSSVTTPEAVAPPDVATTESQTGVSADSGTIETALGTFSWQHLSGDRETLPYPDPNNGDGVIPTSSGYAAIEHIRDPNSDDPTPQYWHSPDGYEWALQPFPVPVEAGWAQFEELGGDFWLTTLEANRGHLYLTSVWRSDDGEIWSQVLLPEGASFESLDDVGGTIWLNSKNPAGMWRLVGESWALIDTSALTTPEIAGVEWNQESRNGNTWVTGAPATVGETTLIPWDLNGSPPDYGFGEFYSHWDPATQTMALWDPSESGYIPVATLSVEADGNRFVFSDEAGNVVHEITINDDSLDPADLFDSESFGNFRQLGIGVLDGEGRVTASVPPWGGFDSQSDAELLAVDGQFLAFVTPGHQSGSRSDVEQWTSTDGQSWTGPERPGFLASGFGEIGSVRVEGDVVLAELGVGDHDEVWVSDDGISWTDTGLRLEGSGQGWSYLPFDSGGFYVANTEAGYQMFVSADLRTWEKVDTSQLGIPSYQGAPTIAAHAAGDTLFITNDGDATGTRDMWVLEPQG